MSAPEQTEPHPFARRVSSAVGTFEDWTGLIFAILLTCLCAAAILDFAQLDWAKNSAIERIVWIAAGLAWLALDLPYMVTLAITARHHRKPFALQAARAQWVAPWLLRLFITLWWLGHFVLGFGGAVIAAGTVTHRDPLAVQIGVFFLVAIYGYAANGYLILGACALTRDESIRWTVWQFRALIDIALALLSLGVWHA